MSIRKVQLGKEDTAGTAVAATTIYRAPANDIKDARVKIIPDENIGYYQKLGRSYDAAYNATHSMAEHEATFEQIGYILNAGIEGVAGVADGAGTGYTYTRTMPTTAEKTCYTYTLEGRNTTEPVEMEYGFVSDFSISGAPQEAWMLSAEWKGRQATTCDYTAALSVPAVEEILFGKTKIYIDDTTATIGTSQKAGTLLGFNVDVVTGWDWLYTGDGQLYPYRSKFYPELMAVTGSITFEFDGTATAEEVYWKAGTVRQLRLIAEGSALSTTATYGEKTQVFDAAVLWTEFNTLENRNGNDVVTIDFEAVYDSDAALYCEWLTVNELSALT